MRLSGKCKSEVAVEKVAGNRFSIDDLLLETVESCTCSDCAGEEELDLCVRMPECRAVRRRDGKSVIFKEIKW